jgi:hypothetical protein
MMHFMTWHIIFFSKIPRILEEFMKNTYIKIPPKSHFQVPKVLPNFESIENLKIITVGNPL